MKKLNKLQLIATSLSALLFLVAFVITVVFVGNATESEIGRGVEKAKLISKDFSIAVMSEEVTGTEVRYDPFLEEEIKIIKLRISPQDVLEARYNAKNELLTTEVVDSISMALVIQAASCLVAFIVAVFSLMALIDET